MSTVMSPDSVAEALEMMRAGLSYLAAADAASLPAETQAECLRGLERTDAISTAVRASFLSAFTVGKGYSADADYSARAWLMHKTGITRGAGCAVSGRAEPPKPVATAMEAMARVGFPEDWARLTSAKREGTGPPGPRARSPGARSARSSVHVTMIIDSCQLVRA